MTALRELRANDVRTPGSHTLQVLSATPYILGNQQVASRVLKQFLGGETEVLDLEISTNVHTELERRSYWTLKDV